MKKSTLYIVLACFLMSIWACDPIEDRDELTNLVAPADVELVAMQTTDGGNEIKLLMNTEGVTGYWSHTFGKELTNEATVVYPAKGTFDFTFVGTLGAEFFEKTISVTVENLDKQVDPRWSYILGDNAVEGKTWVFATDRPDVEPFAGSGAGLHFFMVAPYDWTEFWWNAGSPDEGGSVVSDVNAEMTFSLDGGLKYIYSHEGETKVGTFELDFANETLTINDADLVGAYGTYLEDTQGGKYALKKLSDNEIILYQIHGDGFCWIFKPKGYEYN